MANTITSDISALIPAIKAEAMFVAEEASIMRGLVKNFSLGVNNGKTITVPIYPKQTAAGVAENTDLTSGNVVTTSATLTVSEVGIMTTLTDMAVNSAATNVVADVGRLFGEAIARKMDRDLTALFDGFSTSVGGATTALTAPLVFQAVARLRAAGVPGTDLFCVVSPEIAYDLKAGLTNTFANPNAGLIQNAAMATGYVGMLAGVPVFESSNVLVDTRVSKGGLFHRDALGLAMMKDISIELQRDASLRATELVATAVYGVGELYDGYGVELHNQTSLT